MVKRNLLTKTTILGVVSMLALIMGIGSRANGGGTVPNEQAEEGISERSGHHHHECSEATLQGVYLFTSTEASPSDRPDPVKPFVAAGLRTFDGEGNIPSQVATASRNGVISRSVATGTYTLDSDCKGTMTADGVRHWDIFVARDGSEGVAVRTDEGNIGLLTFKRQ